MVPVTPSNNRKISLVRDIATRSRIGGVSQDTAADMMGVLLRAETSLKCQLSDPKVLYKKLALYIQDDKSKMFKVIFIQITTHVLSTVPNLSHYCSCLPVLYDYLYRTCMYITYVTACMYNNFIATLTISVQLQIEYYCLPL